jgi:hypothetical protein
MPQHVRPRRGSGSSASDEFAAKLCLASAWRASEACWPANLVSCSIVNAAPPSIFAWRGCCVFSSSRLDYLVFRRDQPGGERRRLKMVEVDIVVESSKEWQSLSQEDGNPRNHHVRDQSRTQE